MTTPKNIIKQGGKDNWYTLNITVNPSPTESTFSVEFNHDSVESIDFQTAADRAAQDIASKHKNLYVALSGGVDSEFLAEVLHRNNIPFTPVIAIIPGLTEHHYAMYWCHKNKITPTVIDLADKAGELKHLAATLIKTIPTRDILYSIAGSYAIEYALTNNGFALVGDPDLTPKDTSAKVFDFNCPLGNMLDTTIGGHIAEVLHTNAISFLWYTPELILSAARELDTTVNFDIARAKLYNVPYRPKQQQRLSHLFDSNTKSEIDRVLTHIGMSEIPTIEWDKDFLISVLNK